VYPKAGERLPDIELPDHTGRIRTLTDVAAGDPLALLFSRGWWCPKEQRHLREMTAFQDELEVAYARLALISVDPPEVQAAFRAGLGARFTFLSDSGREWVDRLHLLEETDTIHRPYRPTGLVLFPDLKIHRVYDGNWYLGRPAPDDLRRDLREVSSLIRNDFSRS
jgi:peroxiredoxin